MDMTPVSARDMQDTRERFESFIYFRGPFSHEVEIAVDAMITREGRVDEAKYQFCEGPVWFNGDDHDIDPIGHGNLIHKLDELTLEAWKRDKERTLRSAIADWHRIRGVETTLSMMDKARMLANWTGEPHLPCVIPGMGWTCGDCPASDSPTTDQCKAYAEAYLQEHRGE